jgi:hypothetical protein
MANMFLLMHRGSEFLVVLLALVDGNKIPYCKCRAVWRVSDGNEFGNSTIAVRLARQNIELPPDENFGGVPFHS